MCAEFLVLYAKIMNLCNLFILFCLKVKLPTHYIKINQKQQMHVEWMVMFRSGITVQKIMLHGNYTGICEEHMLVTVLSSE